MAEEVDIEHHIYLRSFIRPVLRTGLTPIVKAVAFALLIHSLLFLYWHPLEPLTVADIPQWMNIKLVAGFEEKKNTPPAKSVAETKMKIKDNNKKIKEERIKKNIKKNTPEDKTSQQHKIKEKISSPASATTFIKAVRRPYSRDNPKPVYPTAARRRGMQGVVLLSVTVNIKGNVGKINILRSSGFRVLDMAALNSVTKWKFIPAQQGKRAVASVVQIPVRFTLENNR